MSYFARPKSNARLALVTSQRQLLHRLCLEALEDRWAPATLLVTNTNDTGPGSFRQAILDSNASVGVLDSIDFNIPGSGVQTITPASALPAITDPVIIDGSTQPGYSGTPLIELDGVSAGSSTDGLDINAGNTTIKGLTITGFLGNGISIVGCSNNLIQANDIVSNNAPTFSSFSGILIDGSVAPSESNIIGGTTAGTGNVISGNAGVGIEILGSAARQNLVQGNVIGIAADGHTPAGNHTYGVEINEGNANTVGGTAPGAGNTIWYNGAFGVITGSNGPNSQNDILSNSIFENENNGTGLSGGGGGISTDNVAFPTLDSALPASGGGTVIKGSLQSTPNTTFRIEFFSNSIRDLSDFGQGQTFLGFQNVTTDGAGAVSFTATFAANLPVGTAVSATATGPNDNTSKFSRDFVVPATLMVTNTNDSGAGSFRQAILDSNANVGALNTIDFAIPGSGVQTIIPASVLPTITDPVVIDGTTQPGYAGKPLIELDGANAGPDASGLIVNIPDSTLTGTAIKGLAINRFPENGISLDPGSNVLIQGNFIGTNAAGTAALGNGSNGILIFGDFFQNHGSAFNTIGGTTAGAGNVISGNQGSGVEIDSVEASHNLVEGNFIGTGADGQTALPNSGNGVWISFEANNNTVGGTVAGAANIIAFNALSGVLVDNIPGPLGHFPYASHNGILSNSIFANRSLGITIQFGANNFQSIPTLSSAIPVDGGGIAIKGSLHQFNASDTFRIEFFLNATPDPSGFGQGQTFLVFQNVTTDSSGNASFTAVVPGSLAPGQAITATATGLGPGTDNNSSQFSRDVPPLASRDLAGRTGGQWWVANSTGSSFKDQLWGGWSPAVTWVDVVRGDFTGDGHDDIAGRTVEGGAWWLAVSNGSSFTDQLWTIWSTAVTWVDVQVGDFNGDGKADIAGRVLETGDWWVALSNGTSFTNQRWTTWSTAVTWKDVLVGDFTGDGRDDIAGRTVEGGQWWVANSTGFGFNNQFWGAWSTAVTWVDVRVADFNGDGFADIAGRALENGQWWLGVSTGSSFTNSLWTTWNPNVTWVDVSIGDFNGAGLADIAGRVLESGQWWVATSSGSSFDNSLWTTWNPNVTWVDVQVGDFDGNGKADITGRVLESGQWWVALSDGSQFANQLWTTWSTSVTWVDVKAGRFR